MKKRLHITLASALTVLLAVVLTMFSAAATAHIGTANSFRAQTAQDAKTLYEKSCASCHGKDGRSKTFRGKITGARNLTEAKWQSETSDEKIYEYIANGKGKMPAFSKKYSNEDIKKLVSYVRLLKK